MRYGLRTLLIVAAAMAATLVYGLCAIGVLEKLLGGWDYQP
jgi:hypothetical protein